MNVLTGIWNRLVNWIFPKGVVKDKFGVDVALSQRMEESINLWYAMYVNQPPWKTGRVNPLGLPSAICREVSRASLLEFKADITGGARADYLQEQFNAAEDHFLRDLEIGLALGGIALKPYLFGDKLLVDATSAAGFQPTKFDAAGTCIGGVFKDKPVKSADGNYYIRLEYHELSGSNYTIRNRGFRSDSNGAISSEVSIDSIPEWADITPEVFIQDVDGPLFAYFKPPISNNIDANSPAGVSIYSGSAVNLICQADRQWADIEWEYRSGKRKIYTDGTSGLIGEFDRDIFETAPYGGNDGLFHEFSPDFRDEALYRGFQNTLKQIEYQTGLAFGTISDPQTVDRTATEVRSSKQRMYVTVDSIQKALEHTFDRLIYAMDVYATLYKLAPAGDYEISYDWGDSVLDDEETKTARNNDMRLDVAAGLIRGELYLAKKYGVTEEDALAMMPGINELVAEPQSEIE